MQNKPIRHRSRWRIRWTDEAGARKSATFESYKDAERELHQHQAVADKRRLGLLAPEPSQHTFNELCDSWLELRASAKRSRETDVSLIRSGLRPGFGAMRIADLTPPDVDRYKIAHRHLAPTTVNHHLTLLVSMLRHAIELGWISKLPTIRKLKLPEATYSFLRSEDEVRRFLRAALHHANRQGQRRDLEAGCEKQIEEHKDVHALYATAVYTGMRLGELAALRWDAIDLELRLITVHRSHEGPTKGGEIRRVPILDPLLPILRSWRLFGAKGRVFTANNGGVLKKDSRVFREVMARVLEGAGFEKGYITFHDLRHTFASHWMMNGGDLFKLQRILGHKSADMTQRYAHLAPDAFQGDFGRFNKLAVPEASPVADLGVIRFAAGAR